MPTDTLQHEPLLTWDAPLHREHNRSRAWYLMAAVIIGAAALYGFLSGIWTLSIVVLVIGSAYALTHKNSSVREHYILTVQGITLGQRTVRWEDCTDFWLINTPQACWLHIHLKKGIQRELKAEINHIDEPLFKATVSQFLEFRPDQKETFVDACIRLLTL